MDACTRERFELLREKVRFLFRRFSSSASLAGLLDSLARSLEAAAPAALRDISARLGELAGESPVVRAALEDFDEKLSVDRAEAFLADLAEDRSTAPDEIVPLIEHYITRLREVISQSWDRQITRRELDAHVMQVRLSYSQDLDRILQGLLPSAAG